MTLPVEVWDMILSLLSHPDLLCICPLSRLMWQVARLLLWYEPQFQTEANMGLKQLQALAKLNLPIKSLRLFDIRVPRAERDIKRLVSFIAAKFDLVAFKIDKYWYGSFNEDNEDTDEGCHDLSIKQLECFLRLPVTHINTRSVSFYMDTSEFVSFLERATELKEVVVDGVFHDTRKISDWVELSRFPIVEVNTEFFFEFSDLPVLEQLEKLEHYDNVMAAVSPTRYIIDPSSNVMLHHLLALRSIKITKLHLPSLSETFTFKEYASAMAIYNQTPTLVIPGDGLRTDLLASDMGRLFQFPIEELYTKDLPLTRDNIDEVVDLIVDNHTRQPMLKFVPDITHVRNLFRAKHVRLLRAAGLIRDIRTKAGLIRHLYGFHVFLLNANCKKRPHLAPFPPP